jgi:hypothetical protein
MPTSKNTGPNLHPIYETQGGLVLAYMPELPGLATAGTSQADALDKLLDCWVVLMKSGGKSGTA